MAKTTSFFEDLNGSSNKDSKDNAGGSSDLLSIASLAKETPAPAATQKSETAKVEPASVTPDTKAKPADTTSSLPKLAMVDTAAIIGTSQTIRLTGAEIEPPPEKGGFLSGLTDGGAKIVTGMAKMVLNEEKTSEQRAKDADRSLAGNLVNTGHTLATTVTDSKARAAIGDAIADQTKKVMSGDTYAIGETTAFVGSFFIPGAATARGTSGLTNTGRALNTATKLDDALGLVSRVKPGSVIDDMATKFRPGSVLDDAARANPAATLGDEASAIASRTAKPGPVTPSNPSFSTRLSTTVEDLSVAARRTVNESIEAFTGRSVPKLATETGTGATLRTGNGTSLLEGLGVKTPGNLTPGRFTLPRTGKPGSILDEIGTGSLADDVGKGPKPVLAERTPVVRDAKPVVREAADVKPVIREAADVKPAVREAADVKPVIREAADVKPAVREAADVNPAVREAADVNPAVREAADVNPAVREAADVKPVVREAADVNPVVREAADVNPVVREAADVKPVVREAADVKPVVRE
ncbi:hypothetical protein GC174_13360, partial [bacterium]|nr:hypothetical protein [bacterium]